LTSLPSCAQLCSLAPEEQLALALRWGWLDGRLASYAEVGRQLCGSGECLAACRLHL
jgi:hypothetical protein